MTWDRLPTTGPLGKAHLRPSRRLPVCLLPALCGFVAYMLYPRLVRGTDALDWMAALDARAVIQQGDVIMLIVGIVISAVWWFYSEHPEH